MVHAGRHWRLNCIRLSCAWVILLAKIRLLTLKWDSTVRISIWILSSQNRRPILCAYINAFEPRGIHITHTCRVLQTIVAKWTCLILERVSRSCRGTSAHHLSFCSWSTPSFWRWWRARTWTWTWQCSPTRRGVTPPRSQPSGKRLCRWRLFWRLSRPWSATRRSPEGQGQGWKSRLSFFPNRKDVAQPCRKKCVRDVMAEFLARPGSKAPRTPPAARIRPCCWCSLENALQQKGALLTGPRWSCPALRRPWHLLRRRRRCQRRRR